jgi:hypothetical protein
MRNDLNAAGGGVPNKVLTGVERKELNARMKEWLAKREGPQLGYKDYHRRSFGKRKKRNAT